MEQEIFNQAKQIQDTLIAIDNYIASLKNEAYIYLGSESSDIYTYVHDLAKKAILESLSKEKKRLENEFKNI